MIANQQRSEDIAMRGIESTKALYSMKAIVLNRTIDRGHFQVWEMIDYPGINVVVKQDRPAYPWRKKITFQLREFEKIEDAIFAWKDAQVIG